MLNKVSIKVAFSLLLIWYLWIVFHSINSKSSQAIWRHHAICLSWDRIGTMPSNVEQSINHLRYFRMQLFKEYCWLRTNSRRKCLKSNALFTVRSCRYDVRQANINMLTLCFFALRLYSVSLSESESWAPVLRLSDDTLRSSWEQFRAVLVS